MKAKKKRYRLVQFYLHEAHFYKSRDNRDYRICLDMAIEAYKEYRKNGGIKIIRELEQEIGG